MAAALQPLNRVDAVSTSARRPPSTTVSGIAAWLRFAPALTIAAFAGPIVAGLVGTLLPAFGLLPAIGGKDIGLQAWRALFAFPGFRTSLELTLFTGWAATLLAVLITFAVASLLQHSAAVRRLGAGLAPLLAMPHSALAIGFAFLVTPSGWLARLVSPGLSGWSVPPDVSTVGHASGWPIVACLLLKEVPYLLLMTLGALNQVNARAHVNAACALGYAPSLAWLKVVLPQVYAQIRLPILAVLAFSLSVVDVAVILGPGNPPTLAVQAVRWFSDPDVQNYFPAAAAATLLLGLVAASIGAWLLLERLVAAWGRAWAVRGARGDVAGVAASVAGGLAVGLALLASLSMLSMVLWSFAARWRFPDAWPVGWTLANWARQLGDLQRPVALTLAIGAASTLIALVLTLACLENETGAHRAGRGAARRGLALLYLPLLVPQVAFLFGAQVLLIRFGLDATLLAVIWAHLIFVLPYLFLSLADPWRAFDARYVRTGLSLGASRWRVFWRIKLPILLRPTLIACAVAFAVSAGLYLPTLFAGGGRIATLTTEAVTLSAGADRRVIGTWAVLQALLPFVGYLMAAWLPRVLYMRRRALA
jgi:putative thiamine transport system permease protein